MNILSARFWFVGSVLATLLALPLNAQAATVPFTTTSASSINMGTIVAGNEGPVDTLKQHYYSMVFYDHANGLLPNNVQITFSYALSKPSTGYFSINSGDQDFDLEDPSFSTPLTIKTGSSVVDGKTIYTLLIANLTGVSRNFSSYLTFFSPTDPYWAGDVVTTYAATAVPLPAALPLLGSGLLGLGLFSRRKKDKA